MGMFILCLAGLPRFREDSKGGLGLGFGMDEEDSGSAEPARGAGSMMLNPAAFMASNASCALETRKAMARPPRPPFLAIVFSTGEPG